MENLELLYSLFNPYVFQDAKNNIESLEYYYSTNPSTSGNPLVMGLLSAIKNYSYETIDVPLFQSILQRDRRTMKEQKEILDEIMKWKYYSKQQMAPTRSYLRDVCAGALIQKANNQYSGSAYEFYKYLKNSDLKLDNSDILSSTKFDNIDIGSLVEKEKAGQGYESAFPWINDLFEPNKKYEMGQMVLITCPPGCMSGDTEVILSSGKVETLENLCKSGEKDIEVLSISGSNGMENRKSECCQISKYVDSWYTVEITQTWEGESKVYHVTEDHPLLILGKGWVRADNLEVGDALVSTNMGLSPLVISKVYREDLETPQPVYDMVNVEENHNYAVRFNDDLGFFSHNTGKTLWMMTEALHMAMYNNVKVHYLAMGDMKPKDFIVRMGSIFTGNTFGDTSRNLISIYNTLRQRIGDRLEISVIPAGQITSDEYVEYVRSKNYDICFIDYDSNFKLKESESMYNDFGIVYNSLTKLTQDGRLVFIAAQPKIATWANSTIELGDVGESARKIHTVDILFTAGKFDSPNHLGIFKCCKNRRGEEGGKIGYIRLNNGRFRFIPIEIAKQLAMETHKKNYTDADIDMILRQYRAVLENSGIVQAPEIPNNTASKINNPFRKP